MNINSIKEALAAKAAGIKTFNASKQDGTTVKNVKMEDVEVRASTKAEHKPDTKVSATSKKAKEATKQADQVKTKASNTKAEASKASSQTQGGNVQQLDIETIIATRLVKGRDYDVIQGFRGKPSLLKPGAERLAQIYGFRMGVQITNRVEIWDKGFVSYETKVTLTDMNGIVVGEGVGSCNSKERKYARSNVCDVVNTVLKMAKKRAMVDAVLTATGASGTFTQDIEDLGKEHSTAMEGIS